MRGLTPLQVVTTGIDSVTWMSHQDDPRHTHRGTPTAGDPRSNPQKVEGTAVSMFSRTTDHLETRARSRRRTSRDRAIQRATLGRHTPPTASYLPSATYR